ARAARVASATPACADKGMTDMSGNEPHKVRQHAARLRPLLPFIAALMALFAVWLAWNGWKQMQDSVRRDSVTSTRDAMVQIASSMLGGETKRLEQRLQSEEVQAALAAGDLDAAGTPLPADLPPPEHAAILPADPDPPSPAP